MNFAGLPIIPDPDAMMPDAMMPYVYGRTTAVSRDCDINDGSGSDSSDEEYGDVIWSWDKNRLPGTGILKPARNSLAHEVRPSGPRIRFELSKEQEKRSTRPYRETYKEMRKNKLKQRLETMSQYVPLQEVSEERQDQPVLSLSRDMPGKEFGEALLSIRPKKKVDTNYDLDILLRSNEELLECGDEESIDDAENEEVEKAAKTKFKPSTTDFRHENLEPMILNGPSKIPTYWAETWGRLLVSPAAETI